MISEQLVVCVANTRSAVFSEFVAGVLCVESDVGKKAERWDVKSSVGRGSLRHAI